MTTTPVTFSADQVRYDKKLGLWTASGDVRASQGERSLLADHITYHEKDDLLCATGNVRFREKTGDIVFAEYVELTDNMKEGVMRHVRILMKDSSRIAARAAYRRDGGQTTRFEKVSYTPCARCEVDRKQPPLWHLEAESAELSSADHTTVYVGPTLTFHELPIAYFPWVKLTNRKSSGFLTPRFGVSSDMGSFFGLPYYWDINPKVGNRDMTITPYITTKQGGILKGEYRQHFSNTLMTLSGSINVASTQKVNPQRTTSLKPEKISSVRGHFFGEGKVDINKNYRLTIDEKFVSDKTYFRSKSPLFSHTISSLPLLESKTSLERFETLEYLSVQSIHYQGLRDQDQKKKTPLILPVIQYSRTSKPLFWKSYITVEGNALSLYRRIGPQVQRAILEGKWVLPYTSRGGHIFTLSTSLRGDVYHTQTTDARNHRSPSKTTFRAFPQAVLSWRYPLLERHNRIVIEPVLQIVSAPNKSLDARIPDQDSQGFELNDNNILNPNRLPGYDRLDGGTRLVYGVQFLTQDAPLKDTSFFIGQAYSISNPSHALRRAGLYNRLSDLVGRFHTSPSPFLSLDYRFRLGRKRFQSNFNEIEASLGTNALRLSTNYVYTAHSSGIDSPQAFSVKKFEQWGGTISSQFTKFWHGSVYYLGDIKKNRTLSHGMTLTYQDECLTASANMGRTFYQDKDVKPSTVFLFSLSFKNLGSTSYRIEKQHREIPQNPPDPAAGGP